MDLTSLLPELLKGFTHFTVGGGVMILAALVLIYLAVFKEIEPVLLLYVLLGAVMDELSMLLLTIPVIFPVVMGLDLWGLAPDDKAIWFGVLLGVNIGVITGFLKLDDLLNLRNLLVVAFAAGVGYIVEKLGGHIYYNLSSSYAQALEKRDASDSVKPIPLLQRWFPVVFLSPLALLIGVSMVMVDALGLQMLHEEALRKLQLEGVETGRGLFPFWVYLAVGAIVSLPYLVYKAVRGWREAEIRQREAHIEYLMWQHIEERRKEPAVQEAFVLGNRAASLRMEIETVQAKLEDLKARLDAARTQAIGLHKQFQDYFQSLLESIRGEQTSQLGFAGASGGYRQESFGQRLKRWLFGR